jgi:hypothetical protein
MDDADALPPNIKEFNEIATAVFAQLYIEHPLPKALKADEIAGIIGASPTENLKSGRTFDVVFRHTLQWLWDEGYIKSRAGRVLDDPSWLSDKALYGMNVVPPALQAAGSKVPALPKAVGTTIVEATEQAKKGFRKEFVDIAGSFIGSIIRSALGG